MCQEDQEVSVLRPKKINVFQSCFPGARPPLLPVSLHASALSLLPGFDMSGWLADTVIEGQVINCVSAFDYDMCCMLTADKRVD